MATPEEHLLSAAMRVWKDIAPELQTVDAAGVSDGVLVHPDELKKVTKWMQHAVTKFGASASVADGAERDRALQPIAEEVIKAFTAAIGTLLSMRRGAGPTLLAEIREAGSGLATAVDALGAVAATEGDTRLSMAAGKVLDRVKHVEKVPTQNRAAVRRRLLTSLAQLRDASREMREALGRADEPAVPNPDGLDDDGWFSEPDETMEPEERRVVESVVVVAQALEEALKEASRLCVPDSAGSNATLDDLENAATAATSVSSAIDGLAAHAIGGLEVDAMRKHFVDLQGCVGGLEIAAPSCGGRIAGSLPQLHASIESAA